MARARLGVLPVVTTAALLVSACGSGNHSAGSHTTVSAGGSGNHSAGSHTTVSAGGSRNHSARSHTATHAPATHAPAGHLPRAGPRVIPTPPATGFPPNPGAVQVITAWANALRRGDVRAAASYFRVPSELINGPDSDGKMSVIVIRDLAQATAAQEALPCGARFISADQRGQYVNALFMLTARPGPGGSTCSGGVGATARTNFLIANGHIVQWIRAPDDPGDNGSPPAQGSGSGGPIA